MKQRIIEISHWTRAFVLAALLYATVFVLLLSAAVRKLLPPVSDSVLQAMAQAAGSAVFVLVAAAAAPSPRKLRVSLTVALVLALASAALAWRFGRAFNFTLGTLFGAACAVLLFRLRKKPVQAAVPSVLQERLPGQPGHQPEERTPASATGRRLSDGWVLALASTGSYALAFAYEAGFDSFYGIPPSLISLNLTTALVAAAAGISALVASYSAISILLNIVPHSALPKSEGEARWLAVCLTVGLLPLTSAVIAGINLIVVALGAVLWIVLWGRLSKLPAASQSPTLAALFVERNTKRFLVLDLLVCLVLTAYVLGRHRAMLEPRFTFDKDGSHYIVLRIYDDNILAEPYTGELSNPDNLIVGGGLRFFKVGDKDTPEFHTRSNRTTLSIPHARLVGVDPWHDWLYPYE